MTVKTTAGECKLRWRAYILLALVVSLIGLAIAWRWTTLSDYLDVGRSVAFVRSSDFVQMPFVAVVAIILASVAAIPLAVIIIISAVAYGAVLGPLYVLLGAEIGAAVSFALGKFLGHGAFHIFGPEQLTQFSKRVGNNGLVAVFLIRLIPAAPFAIVNMVAGASHIKMRDFLGGTLLGMIPGVLMITLFVDQILVAVLAPGWGSIALVMAILVMLVGGGYALRHWLGRLNKTQEPL